MNEPELNRILTATQAHPAPYSSLNLHASQISHRSPAKSQKCQAPIIVARSQYAKIAGIAL
jgi:hypothetical protein